MSGEQDLRGREVDPTSSTGPFPIAAHRGEYRTTDTRDEKHWPESGVNNEAANGDMKSGV